jgi:hypothetical protein
MDLMDRLVSTPGRAAVAGDVRANENVALTAIQTLFAREHNRIVAALPNTLSQALKFEIARRVVGAEIEEITYNEFLPAVGVKLSKYRGYNPNVDPTLTNEFATVAFRAHSMVHGEFEVDFEPGTYRPHSSTPSVVRRGRRRRSPFRSLSCSQSDPRVGGLPASRSLGASGSITTMSRSTTRCGVCCSECPGRGRPTWWRVRRPSSTHDASGVVDLGALDITRPRPRHPELQRCASNGPEDDVHIDHRRTHCELPAGHRPSHHNPDILTFTELRDA